MGTRVAAAAALLLALAACSGKEDPGLQAEPTVTTDADCADRIGDTVLSALGWTNARAAEITVRGCHREADQGYIEVRDRTGYDQLCKTLDRSGGVRPGVPADWLKEGDFGRAGYGVLVACDVEPEADVGQTKVVVKGDGDAATEITVAAVAATPRQQVRIAVALLANDLLPSSPTLTVFVSPTA